MHRDRGDTLLNVLLYVEYVEGKTAGITLHVIWAAHISSLKISLIHFANFQQTPFLKWSSLSVDFINNQLPFTWDKTEKPQTTF